MKYLLTITMLFLVAWEPIAAAGVLIKSPSFDSVYYLGSDGKRYVFPNEKVFKSWYSDFEDVVSVTDAQLYSTPIGGNVTYRPGTKLVKITTDPKVYAVDAFGTLRWIVSEEVAESLYGADWAKQVDDVPDIFFTNYVVGSPIFDVSDFDRLKLLTDDLSIEKHDDLMFAPAPKPSEAIPVEIITPRPVITSFSIDTDTIIPTDSFTISWTSENTTTCAVTDAPLQQIPFVGRLPNGDMEVTVDYPPATRSYFLTCADKDWYTDTATLTLPVAAPAFVANPKITHGDEMITLLPNFIGSETYGAACQSDQKVGTYLDDKSAATPIILTLAEWLNSGVITCTFYLYRNGANEVSQTATVSF